MADVQETKWIILLSSGKNLTIVVFFLLGYDVYTGIYKGL